MQSSLSQSKELGSRRRQPQPSFRCLAGQQPGSASFEICPPRALCHVTRAQVMGFLVLHSDLLLNLGLSYFDPSTDQTAARRAQWSDESCSSSQAETGQAARAGLQIPVRQSCFIFFVLYVVGQRKIPAGAWAIWGLATTLLGN